MHRLFIQCLYFCMHCLTLVPTPNVSVTAFHNEGFHSTSLKCIITTVRGISLDIVWMANDKIIKRVNGSLGNLENDSIIHSDIYHIPNVGGDEGTKYHCHSVINESSVAKGKYTLCIMMASVQACVSHHKSTVIWW